MILNEFNLFQCEKELITLPVIKIQPKVDFFIFESGFSMKKNALYLCLIFLFCFSQTTGAISDGMSTKLECNRTKGKIVDFELVLSSVSGKIAAKNIFKEAHHGGCSSGFSSK